MSIHYIDRVWRLSKAKSGTLLVMLALADWADDEGICYPSIPQVATKARMTDRNAQLCIQQAIEELGELRIEERGGRHNGRYYANTYRILINADGTLIKGENFSPLPKIKGEKRDKSRVKPTSPQPSVRTVIENSSPGESPGGAEKEKKKPSDRGYRFADWFRSTLPENVRLTDSWRDQWAKCFDDLVRIDLRSPEAIHAVCQWAREDSFWSKNFLSPLKLRERDRQKVHYYDVFLARLPENGKPAKKPDYKEGF